MNPSSEIEIPCPVCQSVQTHFALKIKDHSVSGESFEIYECAQCSFRFTKDAPADDKIGPYYQSEDYISHSNTRKGLVNNLYHAVRRRTLAAKFHLLEKATGLENAHHLDIGAGTGAFVQYMNKKGWKSTGIEPDERARETARKDHDAILLPAEALNQFIPESFDAISLWHVLEHVHDLYPYLHQIRSLLKPRGLVFIAVPNYTSYDGRKYGPDWAAYDVPRHLYHFSPASMKWLLKEAGFQLSAEVPMWWDSFYISMLSEKYKSGNTSLIKGFLHGSLSDLHAITDKEKCSSLIYVAKKA
jgi:SAM-dependent methyltransferase